MFIDALVTFLPIIELGSEIDKKDYSNHLDNIMSFSMFFYNSNWSRCNYNTNKNLSGVFLSPRHWFDVLSQSSILEFSFPHELIEYDASYYHFEKKIYCKKSTCVVWFSHEQIECVFSNVPFVNSCNHKLNTCVSFVPSFSHELIWCVFSRIL